MLTPIQCKLGRTAVGLGVRELAKAAGVSQGTISRLEAGEALKPSTLARVRAALEDAGVEILDENGDGPGVRLKGAR